MNHQIGVYDSGLGGLSVLRVTQKQLPNYDFRYLADTAYCPYGPRNVAEIRARAIACVGWLISQGARLVVVACNTASAAALEQLRERFTIPIVGMEPGIKPASKATRSRRVAVLATGGTLTSERYTDLIERYANGAEIWAEPCPDLVELVESGDIWSPAARSMVARHLEPLQARGVDTLVLGCTHFHFLAPVIAELAGSSVTIIDTAPAVARRVAQVVEMYGLLPGPGKGALHMATTGDLAVVAPVLARVWGASLPVEWADC